MHFGPIDPVENSYKSWSKPQEMLIRRNFNPIWRGLLRKKTLKHPVFFDQSGNGVFDHVTKCLEFHPESPHKCKNSF